MKKKTPTAKNKKAELMRRLQEYIQSHHMRETAARNKVLEEACNLHQPFVASELIEAATNRGVALGTVYNSLATMEKAGVVQKVSNDTTRMRAKYELIIGKAYSMRLICITCGRSSMLKSAIINNAIRGYKFNNFDLHKYSLYLYGECKSCRCEERRIINLNKKK